MQDQAINTILSFSSERDTDSMEKTLIEDMANLLPLTRISIIRFPEASIMGDYEETISASIAQTTADKHITFTALPRSIPVDAELLSCRETRQSVSGTTTSGHSRLVEPVIFDNKVLSAIAFETTADAVSFKAITDLITGIYCNCQAILHESERDQLTSLFNRKSFDSKLKRMMQMQLQRKLDYDHNGHNLRRGLTKDCHTWLAILDIDLFKQVNDNFGHMYGDEVLVLLSQIMRTSFRTSDLLFRFGGEEFLVLLEPTAQDAAFLALNRFRKKIEETCFPQIGQVTISAGFARLAASDYPPTVIDRADQALYFAKSHGRNCVHNYETLIAEGHLEGKRASGSIDLF